MTDEIRNWFPFGCHLRDDADYKGFNNGYQKHYRISDRVKDVFNQELAELHFIMWDQPNDINNDEAGSHVEICAFGSDGVSSDRKLAEWINSSFQGHVNRSWFMQARDELSALKDLHGRIGAMIAEREAARDKPSEETERTKDGTDKS